MPQNQILSKNQKIPYPYFILFWCLLNLVQAYFTELTSDEGYYWFYSTQLEFGYYDHPPMLALLIHLGYWIFQNELGVRLFSVLLFSGSLFLFFELLPKYLRNNHWLYLFLLSVPILNYVNIIVFPDTPLLAFEILFLYAYQRFLKKEDWTTVGLLGLSIALMFYSKYHGILVLGFTVLSNPRLLLNIRFYIAGLFAFILFLPHIWWQYEHGFPTFAYHLDGRISGFSTRFLFDYILQQLIFFTPFLLICPILYKVQNAFERALKFILIGSLLFFLYASFRTFVHFHWTSIAVIPAVILSTYFYQNSNHKRLLNIGMGVFLVMILTFRVYLMIQIFSFKNQNVDYYHDRDLWAEDVSELANGRAVIFENNLREAGLYRFYSGEEGIALYSKMGKKSQFELWNYEEQLQGQPVLIIKQEPFEESDTLSTRMDKIEHYTALEAFYSYQDIKIKPLTDAIFENDTLSLDIEIYNPRTMVLPFEEAPPAIAVTLHGQKKSVLWYARLTKPLKNIPPKTGHTYTMIVTLEELNFEPEYFYIGNHYIKLDFTIVSDKINITKKNLTQTE